MCACLCDLFMTSTVVTLTDALRVGQIEQTSLQTRLGANHLVCVYMCVCVMFVLVICHRRKLDLDQNVYVKDQDMHT